jgi:hypothetical protein
LLRRPSVVGDDRNAAQWLKPDGIGVAGIVPGMKFASLARCPAYGGKVKSFDPKDALAVAGVDRVVERGRGLWSPNRASFPVLITA